MNYWLIKSEPSVYSWERFMKDKKACWDGVRNYAARNNLKAMKKVTKRCFIIAMKDFALWVWPN